MLLNFLINDFVYEVASSVWLSGCIRFEYEEGGGEGSLSIDVGREVALLLRFFSKSTWIENKLKQSLMQ